MASIGEFIHGGEGFRITEPVTRTPMLNVLCNPEGFACEVSQNGMPSGSFKYEDGETAALISGNNCALYLRDDDTGDIWCIGGYPCASSVENYCCENYAAYTRISSTHDGIDAALRLFVPEDFKGIVFTLTVTNRSAKTRRLSIVPATVMELSGFPAPASVRARPRFPEATFPPQPTVTSSIPVIPGRRSTTATAPSCVPARR